MKRPALSLLMIAVLAGMASFASAQQDKFLDINLSLFSSRPSGYGHYVSHQTGVAHYSTTFQTQTYTTAYPAPVTYTAWPAPVYQTAFPAPVTYPVYQPPAHHMAYYPAFSHTTVSAPVTTYTHTSYYRPRYHRRSHLLEFNAQIAPVPCWNPLLSLHVGLF